MTLPIDVVAQRISENVAPLLLLDTCSVLDVLRVPNRDAIQLQVITAAATLRELCRANPRGVWLISSEIVASEFYEHDQGVLSEVTLKIARLEEALERLHLTDSRLSPSEKKVRLSARRVYEDLEHKLSVLARGLMEETIMLARDRDSGWAAQNRQVYGRRPARKGGGGKDCEIFETFLRLCRQLNERGVHNQRVFVTSNTRDFFDERKRQPHADLTVECAEAGLEFALDLAHAAFLIR